MAQRSEAGAVAGGEEVDALKPLDYRAGGGFEN